MGSSPSGTVRMDSGLDTKPSCTPELHYKVTSFLYTYFHNNAHVVSPSGA